MNDNSASTARSACVALALALALTLAATVAACSAPTATPAGPAPPTTANWETEAVETMGATPAPIPVVLGLPFQPDVQFTPLYVAKERGYYIDQGFDVSFEYGDESSFVRLVATRDMSGVIASGEQVILARAQDIPVTYVLTWYQRFAGVVFSDDPAIASPADLVGRRVGLPAQSGASYTGWLALLAANEIDPRSVDSEVIGYTQAEYVLQGRGDAAVGYAANEPVQLRARDVEPTVIEIADSFDLVSNGLVVAEGLIRESPEVVQALVTGTLMGIRDTLDNPDGAFDLALQVVQSAADPAVRATQRQVLEESLRFWEAPTLGAIDEGQWTASQRFMLEQGMIEQSTPVDVMTDARFVDQADFER